MQNDRPTGETATNDFVNEVEVICIGCKKRYQVARTWDVLQIVTYLEVNYCPNCIKRKGNKPWIEKAVTVNNKLHAFRHRFNMVAIVNGKEKHTNPDHKR